MSAIPHRSEDYNEQREKLREKTAQKKQEDEQAHNALLEAAAAGEEPVLEETETVEIGDVEVEAHTQIPGSVMRKYDRIMEGEVPPGEILDTIVDVLAAQTVSISAQGYTWEDSGQIRRFYRDYIDERDAEGRAERCLSQVIEKPNELEEKRKEAAVNQFPEPGRGRSDRARTHRNGR